VPGTKFERGEDVQRGRSGRIGTIFVLDNKKDGESYIADNYGIFDPGNELDGHNDIIDAFRHTAWNALNAKDLGADNSYLSDSEIFDLVLNEVTKDDSGVVKWAPDEGPATYECGNGYGSGPYRK
jgi:hypothetical protein